MKEHIQNIKALFGSPKKRIIAICFIILIDNYFRFFYNKGANRKSTHKENCPCRS